MQHLIGEYREGRAGIRGLIKKKNKQIKSISIEDPAYKIMFHDISLLEGIVRDMTEAISMMAAHNTYADTRGYQGSRSILMDPAAIRRLEIAAEVKVDPEMEDALRKSINEKYGDLLRARLEDLTQKQRTTVDRWISGSYMSEIGREDGVSRQAVRIRIFGDKTNRGALRILKGE